MARYIGQYEIVNELGAGQYGTVYLAAGEVPARGRRPPRRRIVAIKKLRNTADDESVAQLTREFSLLDQVKHRGIVRVFDYVEQEHSVVMEYIHGSTLRNILDKLQSAREQVFTEAAVEIGCEIADALYQAYTTPGDNGEPLQLVHRDLKPDNIMLTRQGEVKVLDWGLARVDNTDFRGSNPDRIKGTLLYMAPEQARGDAVDHRSDVFSLGLILFEMLMREPLYQVNERAGDPLSEVMRAIETGDTAARCAQLETRLPQVGPVLTRALRPRPAERYPTAQDMMVDLRRTLYRERGADLKEFCEFYFGQISDIGPAPKLEDIGAGMTKPKSERLSIEERLRRSMARDKGASPLADGPSAGNPVTGGAPVRPPVGGGASRATPFTPSSRGPRAPRAPSAPRAPVATPRAPAAPPRAPQVSRAPAAPPRAPQATRPPMGAAPPPPPKARKPMTPVGSRSPDETGMLKMVPLNDDEDEVEVQGDPSATMFFAIPAPKAERSRPAPPPTPGAGGPPPPPGVGGPPPPPRPGGFAAGPPQPPMQRAPLGGGPGALGAPPPPAAIRGPVAGAGGPPAGGATPFQTAGNLPPPGDNQQRTNSHRAYALVTAAIMVVCVGLGAAFLFVTMNKDDEKVASATPTEVAPEPSKKAKKKRKKAASDTGEPEEEKPKKKSSRRTARRSPSSTPAAPKAKPKPTGPAPLTVVLKTPDQATKVEVQCPGVRQRANFSGGRAVLQGVPQSGCKLFFKGAGAMAVYEGSKVAGGRTLSCSLASGAARCN